MPVKASQGAAQGGRGRIVSRKLITAFGETKSMTDWTRDSRCSVCVSVLCWRLNHGVDAETAITAPQPRYWTDAEDAIVRQYATGKNGSWGECAKLLGRSVVSIRSRAARLGCERQVVEISDDQIRELHEMGLQSTAKARVLGVTDETVRRHERALGLPSHHLNEEWRNSPQRKATARLLAGIRQKQRKVKSASLGWPSLAYQLALTMVALERLGVADKRDVAAERVKICDENGWRRCGKSEAMAISMLLTLEMHGYVVAAERHVCGWNKRKRYRLRRGIKTMPDSERLAIVAVIRKRREEFGELRDQHRAIISEVRRKHTNKRKEALHAVSS